jgi:hypothetical protein
MQLLRLRSKKALKVGNEEILNAKSLWSAKCPKLARFGSCGVPDRCPVFPQQQTFDPATSVIRGGGDGLAGVRLGPELTQGPILPPIGASPITTAHGQQGRR